MIGDEDGLVAGRENGRPDRISGDPLGGLFDAAADEAAPILPQDTIARAFELARSGGYASVDSIAEQLKAERLQGVDVRLFDASIRKSLRQACAEGRIALLRQGRVADRT
jgi:hypothetical protein